MHYVGIKVILAYAALQRSARMKTLPGRSRSSGVFFSSLERMVETVCFHIPSLHRKRSFRRCVAVGVCSLLIPFLNMFLFVSIYYATILFMWPSGLIRKWFVFSVAHSFPSLRLHSFPRKVTQILAALHNCYRLHEHTEECTCVFVCVQEKETAVSE